MKRYGFLFFLLCAVLSASVADAAASLKFSQSPKKVGPGDLFVITIVAKKVKGPLGGTFDGKPVHFNPSGSSWKALIGVDLYKDPGTYALVITAGDETVLERDIKVSKKKYPLQRLTLPDDKVTLSPENEARVEQEQKRTAALWPVDSPRLWKGRFIDPLPGMPLGTPFGVRRIINNIPKNSHSGVDITADEGVPVKAPNDGVVALVEEQFFSGNSVFLDHGQGIYTMFFHLSEAKVKPGQTVKKGDVIGLVGATGRVSGAHLHWGARVQGSRVDALQLIKLKLD